VKPYDLGDEAGRKALLMAEMGRNPFSHDNPDRSLWLNGFVWGFTAINGKAGPFLSVLTFRSSQGTVASS